MSRPMKTIHNVETGKIIERELNNEEFAQYEADQEADIQRKLSKEARALAKADLLQRLGITADEAKLLLS